MKVLCIIPPYIPSYFNAGHHLPVFQVSAYLRKHRPHDEIVAIDAAAMNMNWKDISKILVQKFDVIALMNDFDGIDTYPRMARYIREFSPRTKIITFGRLSNQVPGFFKQFNFDGIASEGDYEASVAGFLEWIDDGSCIPPGVSLLQNSNYQKSAPGVFLEASEWVFPEVKEIPYSAYDRMYIDDLNKFCGIPERRELVVPLARGCPVGCKYCDVPLMQGFKERRVKVDDVLDYIQQSFATAPFEYVSFYAPTFTLNKAWVKEFCEKVKNRRLQFSWKCVTTTFHLNAKLLAQMGESGCIRVSVGLETLDTGAAESLPKIKRDILDNFRMLSNAATDANIEMNCFVIVGLPGDSIEGIDRTISEVIENKCRVRPTIYTPYNQIVEEMSVEDIGRFNRQTFVDEIYSSEQKDELYKLILDNEKDRATDVMKRIEKRNITEEASVLC